MGSILTFILSPRVPLIGKDPTDPFLPSFYWSGGKDSSEILSRANASQDMEIGILE
jgi:hypothetical protein